MEAPRPGGTLPPRSASRFGPAGVFVAVFTASLVVCLVTSAWLYRTDRIARAWNPSPAWAPSYGGVIRSDGVGYFAWTYALATGDFCFAPYIAESEAIQPAAASGFHLETSPGCFLPQYSMGLGALWTPGVVAVRGLYGALHKPLGAGWISPASGIGILLGSSLTASLGVACLVAFCRRRLRTWTALVATGSVFVGMFGFHYATFDAEFSHATSFGLFAAFVLLVDTVRRRRFRWSASTVALALALGIDIGLIGLVRIPNLAIVAVYLCAAFWSPARSALRGGRSPWVLYGSLGLVALAAAVTLSAQPIAWFRASGRWLPNTYVGSGFHVSADTPAILVRLLADPTWHGALVWSPIFAIAAAGLALAWWTFGYAGVGAALAIGVLLLTSATWSDPVGGGGIGLRFLVDVAPFVVIGVACAFRRAQIEGRRTLEWALAVAAVSCAGWSLLAMLGYWSARFPITGATLGQIIEVVTSPRLL